MGTVQVVLRKKQNLQKQYPIAIRITRNRKSSFIHTGQYVPLEQWDPNKRRVKRSHPNASQLNQLILTKIAEANNKLLDSELSSEKKTLAAIKKAIKQSDILDFKYVSKLYLNNLANRKQFHRRDNEEYRINRFIEFTKKAQLPFNSITVNLLMRYQTFLMHEKGLAARTVMNYIIPIRSIFNLAIMEGIAERNHYPFGRGKFKIAFPESEKIGLTIEEIRKLESAQELTSSQYHALDLWLLSFYFAGIRVTDIVQLKWSDFADGRLQYRMQKNQKLVSLKVPEKAARILEKYEGSWNDRSAFIFDELKDVDLNDARAIRTRINTTTRKLNRHLGKIAMKLEIDKKLTMHIARHSFGNISGDRIPIQMLQKLYRHSSVTTTIRYQANFMRNETDEALDKVVNF